MLFECRARSAAKLEKQTNPQCLLLPVKLSCLSTVLQDSGACLQHVMRLPCSLSLRRSARLDGKATKYLSPEVTSEMGSSSGDDVVEVEKSHSSSNKDKTCRTKSAKRERKQMKKESRKTRKKQRKKTKTKRRKRKALSSESSTTFSSCGFLRGTCSSAVA